MFGNQHCLSCVSFKVAVFYLRAGVLILELMKQIAILEITPMAAQYLFKV